MGLLGILSLPLTGPFKGLLFVAEHVLEEAERSLYDEGVLRGALLELELRLERGDIGEKEYAWAEQELMERLKTAQ